MKRSIFLITFMAGILIQSVSVFAGGLQPFHLEKQVMVSQVAVSPCGDHVAYTRIHFPKMSEEIGSAYSYLYVYHVNDDEHVALIDTLVRVFGIGWTPDGEAITFRQAIPGARGAQVFSVKPDGEDRRQLTDFPRSVRDYGFINDSTLAITATAKHTKEKANLLKQGINLRVFEEEMRHIELWRYNINSGEKTALVDDATVFDFTLSPSGKFIGAAIAPENSVDASYMFKRVHVLDAETGAILHKIENPGKLGQMDWSPDESKLAFKAASKREDAVCGSIFIFDLEKHKEYGDLRNYTEGMELSAIGLKWKDNNNLMIVSEESVDITIRNIDLDKDENTIVMEGGLAAFRSFDYHDGTFFFAGHTAQHPSELMSYSPESDQATLLSNHNAWLEGIEMARQEKISYEARDGMRIDGVLIYPLNYEEGKSYPLITYIHGGPEAAVQNGWLSGYSHWGQFAAARDFFVFYPNYRASSGRGVDFTMAGYGKLLETEYDDVLDGIDYLIHNGMVDPERVGMGGGSYGGYFSAWSATKHSERFAASVVFVGVTNQVSKRNTTDIPWEDYLVHWGFWTHENFDKVWGASPVKYTHKSNTPTLVLHGEDDPRVRYSQGLELYRSLKLHSQAPVRFIVYPGEGHGNRLNVNRFDYLKRTLDWFDFYLIQNPGSKEMPQMYYEYIKEEEKEEENNND